MARGPSLATLLRTLDLSREDEVPATAWLDETRRDPPAFHSLLDEHARSAAPPALASRPDVAIDLYMDAVQRHTRENRVAMRHYDRNARAFRDITFADLDARAAGLAGAWAAEGVGPGDPLAIVLPLGPDYLAAFAAALRIGALPVVFPPAWGRLITPRIKGAKPKRIVFDPRRVPPIGKDLEKLALDPFLPPRPPILPPHSFAPDDPCAFVVAPTRLPLGKARPLSAKAALQRALCDAFVTFRLAPGRAIAAPGLHHEQHFPALLLASLLAGATFVHIEPSDLDENPSLLTDTAIHVLGVPASLCDRLRKKPVGRLSGLEFWFRPVDEPLDWPAYQELVKKNDWGKIPAGNVLVDSAYGGAMLFSARRPGHASARVLPAAGQPYSLVDAASGELTSEEHGLFVPLPSKKPLLDGYFILARTGAEHLYGSTRDPRRAARIFPEDDVVALVADLPFVKGACVAPIPSGPGARYEFHLVLFTGAQPGEDAASLAPERCAEVEKLISEELGPDGIPDRIACLPLWPKQKGKKVDAEACRAQYASGRLFKKATDPAMMRLAELRGAVFSEKP
jgi:hypothetical protein